MEILCVNANVNVNVNVNVNARSDVHERLCVIKWQDVATRGGRVGGLSS
jgi:hypothetical protein